MLGQSFGGFCITTYLSTHPDAIRYAYLTGGLPGLVSAEDTYRATYAKLAARQQRQRHRARAQLLLELAQLRARLILAFVHDILHMPHMLFMSSL